VETKIEIGDIQINVMAADMHALKIIIFFFEMFMTNRMTKVLR
jgi:hypothetical protein